jgi:lysophospholipase
MGRFAIAAITCAFALSLMACDRVASREALLDSRTPPQLSNRFFPPEGWAWGLIAPAGGPVQRYGVSAPPLVPRGEVVIVPGAGESAETWFETARDLNDHGAVVWILDRSGRGGSARRAGPRGYVHAPDPNADVEAIRALRATVVHGGPNRKVVLLASDDAAAAALRAVQAGAPFGALILSSPRLERGALPKLQAFAVKAGLGALPAQARKAWRRDGPDDVALGRTHDAWRADVRRAWASANPDLRDVGETLATRSALSRLATAALAAPQPGTPLVVLLPGHASEGADEILRRFKAAEVERFDGARPALHLESDAARDAWLEATARAAGLPRERLRSHGQ